MIVAWSVLSGYAGDCIHQIQTLTAADAQIIFLELGGLPSGIGRSEIPLALNQLGLIADYAFLSTMKSDDESTLHSERHSHNNSLSNLNTRCGGDHTGDYDKATNSEIKGQELQREQRTDDRVSDEESEINTDKQQQQRQHDASTSNSTPEHTNNGENAVVEKEQRTDGLDDQTNLMPRKQIIVVFMGVSSALFISLLDQTVISTALPDISSEFHAAGKGNWCVDR